MREGFWPHAPWHDLNAAGMYFITGSTLHKELWFRSPETLDFLERTLFVLAREHDQSLHAWAIFPNHYHLVTYSRRKGSLQPMLKRFHTETSSWLGKKENVDAKRVWFNFRDTHLTFERSYLARLKYVHENPVHHGVARRAENYRWCSASWFAQTAPKSFVETVERMKIDRISVPDDYEVPASACQEE
jgi:putative transposase